MENTLSMPASDHRAVGFTESINLYIANYLNFSGRTSRSGYWFATLAIVLVGFVLSIVGSLLGAMLGAPIINSAISLIWTLATFLPSIAISIRRLHDTDRSGWWLLLVLTGIGALVIIYWQCIRGTAGANRFGPDAEAGRA